MKFFLKILLVLALLIFTAGILLFAWARLEAPAGQNNYFNRVWRLRMDRYVWMRNVINLHDTGDARFDYLASGYKNIIIEVDSMDGLLPDKTVLQQLAHRIQNVTGKPTKYELSDIDLPFEDSSDENQIESLSVRYHNKLTQGDTAAIYLLIINTSSDELLTIGKTHQEYVIILYKRALKEFTDNHPNTLSNYELSTALHEFGHQLGLPHNDQPNCLMGEHAESDHVAKSDPALVVTDFCHYEKQVLKYD